jgi:hypothetical protein
MTSEDLATIKAQQVLDQVGVVNISILILLAGFILQFLQFLIVKYKKNTKEGLAMMQNPGILQRWELRRRFKKHFGNQYIESHSKILKGLQTVAKTTTLSEFHLIGGVSNEEVNS